MALLLRLAIHLYRGVISPLLHTVCGGIGCGCRYHPSCSAFALEAIEVHGAICGSWLSLCRLSRCHPWSSHEGLDPVPQQKPTAVSRL